MFDRFLSALMSRLEALIGIILAVMVVLVFGNVVLRYGFNSGITVSEEISRYLFIWLTFIGAVVAVHEHAHLGVDSLLNALPRKGKLFCVVTSELLMLGATGMLFHGSWQQTEINMATNSPVAQVPLALIYVAGVVASVMMGVLILRNLYHIVFVGATDKDLILSVESEDLAGLEHATRIFLSRPDGRASPPPGSAEPERRK
ncbi:MAG: TRAP transporter small permease [Sulfuritalea sp.]|jgi:TRAP-type C4-dicarboxylate transport system permease small subunit|nr:TRAP transporter small permease [Sulfuritalea sp.]